MVHLQQQPHSIPSFTFFSDADTPEYKIFFFYKDNWYMPELVHKYQLYLAVYCLFTI